MHNFHSMRDMGGRFIFTLLLVIVVVLGVTTYKLNTRVHELGIPLVCSGTVLPQVYIQGKAFYKEDELASLKERVIQPFIDHHHSLGEEVVSIEVRRHEGSRFVGEGYAVSALFDQRDGDGDAGYIGFIHEKKNGEIPMWKPDEAPEGYQG